MPCNCIFNRLDACVRRAVKQLDESRRLLVVGTLIAVTSCGGGGSGGMGESLQSSTSPTTDSAAPASSPAQTVALVDTTLEVPASLASGPFASPKAMKVPSGFGIRLLARVEGARFMALAPNGDVLVSNPGAGTITLVRKDNNNATRSFGFATGLDNPHDMVFHKIGDTTWLYVAESGQVTRSIYKSGDTQGAERQVVVADLPSASLPELQGAYSHALKNIAISPDDKLYVSIASSCNACITDATSDPVRGSIYRYDADGTNRQLVARGLRNAEGLDFLPGSGKLWVTVNSRDQILYPFNDDFDNDGKPDLGKLIPEYVDKNPPDLFTQVDVGADYGWPLCNPLQNDTMSRMPMAPDYEFNPGGKNRDCNAVRLADKGIPAHSAPLGFSFLQNSGMAAPYSNGAAIAEHGCWNCTTLRAGYKVSFIPIDAAGTAGEETDLVTGFVTNPAARTVWGRPVDVIPDGQGSLLISDDLAGAIYQLYRADVKVATLGLAQV
ncbi:MAG: sugar dehydrogenase [Herminiimonas sp.]|nr:sugar dehydrogenase [Herminiimonas sp.]MDB5852061.1 sugar dehydrogenase [Herminiimonas sp.]